MNDEYKTERMPLSDWHVIRNPGKFEGCHVSIPYFWYISLESGDLPNDDGEYEVEFSEQEWIKWPELEKFTKVFIEESDDGFIFERFK